MNFLTQVYGVDKLVTDNGTILFDEKLAAQMFIGSNFEATIVVYNPADVLSGTFNLQQVLKVTKTLLKEIVYTLVGSYDGEKILVQRYKNKFTSAVNLTNTFSLVPTKGSLFIPYQLDVLLSTSDKFPRVTAVQFIA